MTAAARLGVAAVLAAVVPARAHAEDGDGYRTPIIITDVASDVAFGLGLGLKSKDLVLLGTAGYLIGGPIIHVLKDNLGRGAASFGIRAASAGLFGLVGCAAGRPSYGVGGDPPIAGTGTDGCLVGAALGFIVAQAIDAVLLAGGDDSDPPAMLRFGGSF